jgi:hypothetical protein
MNEYIHVITLFLVLLIILPYQIPTFIAKMISSLMGRIIVICSAIGLLFVNPTLGAVAIVAAYEIIQKSEVSLGIYQSRKFRVTEKVKANQIKEMNKSNPWSKKTLEEEIVDSIPRNTGISVKSNVKPIVGDIHDAAQL